MNLKVYFQKVREIEMNLLEPSVVMVSHESPDGGKAGVRTEVPREIAAKMIVEGRARVASAEEASEFHHVKSEAKRLADQEAAANRMQVTVVPADFRNLRDMRGLKEAADK
jgi:hypothetical protein